MDNIFGAITKLLLPALTPVLLTASPFLVFGLGAMIHLRRQKKSDPPQEEKLLRPAGYSLMVKLDDLCDSILQGLFLAAIPCAIEIFSAVGLSTLLAHDAPFQWTAAFAASLLVSTVWAAALIIRAVARLREAQNARLGMRGEQAVAEALNEVADVGYRVFHDLQPEGTWNIDHVVVGSQGIFLIETRARRRYAPKAQQPRHVVIYDGRALIFPSGTDIDVLPQVQRNASWLTDFLAKRTCEVVHVHPIIVVPGWYTETKGNFGVKVMNTTYLRTHLRNQSKTIDPAQVQRIISALDEKCRTLEF